MVMIAEGVVVVSLFHGRPKKEGKSETVDAAVSPKNKTTTKMTTTKPVPADR